MPFRSALLVPAIGLMLGLGIGYVDSRPTWDDAGITAGVVFICAAVLATVRPRSGWLIGVAVGIPVLGFNAALHSNFESAVAVVIALAGAAAGILVGKALGLDSAKHSARGAR